MYRFLNRAGGAGVLVTPGSAAAPKTCRLTFTPELPGPCTVSTAEPFEGPGKFGFTVVMPTKNARTAIGFMSMEPPDARYMTPDFMPSVRSGYVSMGGAGFITQAEHRLAIVMEKEIPFIVCSIMTHAWYLLP